MVLGVQSRPKNAYKETLLPFAPGTTVLLFSDGVTDARGGEDGMFGMERLMESFQRHGDKSAEELVGGILKEIRDFSRGWPQHDDITLVALRRS
jgi:sigma-B regulation protein RsbU (phosphoserine phosphatase)